MISSRPQIISNEESKRLNAVESSFQDAEINSKAIGNASKVVVTIGPGENGPQQRSPHWTPYTADGDGVFAEGGGNRRQLHSHKNQPYGDFSPESSYNVVATSQIASLVANVFSNTAVAENKVVKVFTDPGAPSSLCWSFSVPFLRMEGGKPTQKHWPRQKQRKKHLKPLRKPVKQPRPQRSLNKSQRLGSGLSWEKFSSQLAISVQKPTEKPKVQIATVRGQAKARSLQPKKAVVKLPTFPRPPAFKPKEEPKPKGKQPESKAEVRKKNPLQHILQLFQYDGLANYTISSMVKTPTLDIQLDSDVSATTLSELLKLNFLSKQRSAFHPLPKGCLLSAVDENGFLSIEEFLYIGTKMKQLLGDSLSLSLVSW
ncbi:Protein plastid transcriptionally active 16, chloroplastic [Vitis vinifera]|uniref:Protein plastid transcriptionally active 16, chloroplastic n=1 Tax=Vitis vinifera TaxID=29760 RepID=A0A438F9M7_VITVI|nr:Protein plastid transcriptionally active 16, chloroplastic [Vitis vinifera]